MNEPNQDQHVGLDEARRQVRANLSERHPEWKQSDGECPACAGYEQELAEVTEGRLPHHSLREQENLNTQEQ